MPDELANAESAAVAAASPINGSAAPAQTDTANTASTAPETGLRASFERAKAELNGEDISRQPAAKPLQTPEQQAAVATALKAPERWEQSWKDQFAKAPPDVQQIMLDQHKAWETGFGRRFQELSGAKQFHENVNKAITPELRTAMQRAGLDEAAAVTRLIQRADALERDPVNFIAGLMRQKGIDPRVYLQGQDGEGQPAPSAAQIFGPIVQPLIQKIAELEQHTRSWQSERQSQAEQANETTFASFTAEKDASGAAKFPHVERVAERMADLLENDPRYAGMDLRQGLEEAYTIAVLSDPALRAEIVSAEAAKRAEALERDRATGRFRSAASAKPASGVSAPAPQGKGLRGAFEKAKAQIAAR